MANANQTGASPQPNRSEWMHDAAESCFWWGSPARFKVQQRPRTFLAPPSYRRQHRQAVPLNTYEGSRRSRRLRSISQVGLTSLGRQSDGRSHRANAPTVPRKWSAGTAHGVCAAQCGRVLFVGRSKNPPVWPALPSGCSSLPLPLLPNNLHAGPSEPLGENIGTTGRAFFHRLALPR